LTERINKKQRDINQQKFKKK